MKLQDIGFYTLSDERALHVSALSPMMRCEMILTDRCNFKCPYCRGLKNKGDLDQMAALETLALWCDDGLRNVRFSGGEPLTYKSLDDLVWYAKYRGVKRIAISSNGSFPIDNYLKLIESGANDFSISLDACCAAKADAMAGINLSDSGKWERVTRNIVEIANRVYTTVGIVLTDENAPNVCDIVRYAHGLGVQDIRIIPAAQEGNMIAGVSGIPQDILDAHPILAYRVANLLAGRAVRGIGPCDTNRCYLALDDSVVSGDYHYPCVIYMREQGEPIGKVGPGMRGQRVAWMAQHDTHKDPICKRNCLDVCIDHNNRCAFYQGRKHWFGQ